MNVGFIEIKAESWLADARAVETASKTLEAVESELIVWFVRYWTESFSTLQFWEHPSFEFWFKSSHSSKF